MCKFAAFQLCAGENLCAELCVQIRDSDSGPLRGSGGRRRCPSPSNACHDLRGEQESLHFGTWRPFVVCNFQRSQWGRCDACHSAAHLVPGVGVGVGEGGGVVRVDLPADRPACLQVCDGKMTREEECSARRQETGDRLTLHPGFYHVAHHALVVVALAARLALLPVHHPVHPRPFVAPLVVTARPPSRRPVMPTVHLHLPLLQLLVHVFLELVRQRHVRHLFHPILQGEADECKSVGTESTVKGSVQHFELVLDVFVSDASLYDTLPLALVEVDWSC